MPPYNVSGFIHENQSRVELHANFFLGIWADSWSKSDLFYLWYQTIINPNLTNLHNREGSAEQLEFTPASVDVVTVCTAVHWFDLPAFYAQVFYY